MHRDRGEVTVSGQIDEVSRVLGGIERYIHDNAHILRNLPDMFKGAQIETSKQIKELDKQLNARITELDETYKHLFEVSLAAVKLDVTNLTIRVIALETENSNRKAVSKFVDRIAAVPGIMWLFGGGFVVASYLIGKFGSGGG